jgi:quercetin dioxygenase-like cupin family protein
MRRRGNVRRARLALLVALGLLIVAGAALATPGIGVLPTTMVHARGTIAEELNVHSEAGVKLKTKGSLDVVTQFISIAPGGTTGWHGHPGPVLVTIKSGEMTIYYAGEGCEGRVYRAGETFVDRGDVTVHTARNEGTVNLDFWATYLVPGEPGTPFRIDAPSSGECGF